MYGWSGRFAGMGRTSLGSADNLIAGVDYDPALLGPAAVFPQEDIGPVGSELGFPSPTYPQAGQQSATQWLNANAGKVALGVGGFFAIVILTKAGR